VDEVDPFRGKPIEVGRMNVAVAMTGKALIAPLIDDDPKQVMYRTHATMALG